MLSAPPQEPLLPRRVLVWTVSGVGVLVLGLIVTVVGLKWFEHYAAQKKKAQQATAATGGTSAPVQTVAPEDPVAKAGFEISPIRIEKTPGTTLFYAVGTLKNAAARQRFGVRLELDLLSAAGEKVGTAKDYLAVLERGGQWQFKAAVLESRAVAARVSAIKEDQ